MEVRLVADLGQSINWIPGVIYMQELNCSKPEVLRNSHARPNINRSLHKSISLILLMCFGSNYF